MGTKTQNLFIIKKISNKMSTNENKNVKNIFSSIINMTYCEVCQTSIKNFKIHEKSNKHRKNINNFIIDFNYLDEPHITNKTVKRKECLICNKNVLNLKTHERSKTHQGNLMNCVYKNCREGLNENFKAYCYSNIKSH